MAITWYSSAGQPSDSVGVAGDLNWDTTNRITWGPKTSANTWAGTAYSNIGPVGPAMLSGVGAPGSSYGQNGNGYTDTQTGLTYYKANNAWSQSGNLLGPTGAQGPAVLGNTTASGGPTIWWNSAATSTAQSMYYTGSSIPGYFVPSTASAFIGATVYNAGSAAATITLYDQTAAKSIYSTSIAATTLTGVGTFSTTAYPMTSGNTHVWQITGAAGSTPVTISPYYLMPSNSSTPCVTVPGLAGNVTAQTWGTSATAAANFLPFLGGPMSANYSYYIYPTRVGYLYGVTATYIPSGSTATTATATLTFGSYNKSSGAQTSIVSWTLTANSTPTYFGPFASATYPTQASIQYYFALTASSGSGQVIVTPQYVY